MEFLSRLHHIDKDITLAINSIHCPASDCLWQVFSDKHIWFVLYLAVLIFMFRNLGWKKALICTVSIVLTIVLCDQIGNLSKAYFERLRPCCDLDMMRRGLRCLSWHRPIEYGFYSAHAANSMGFAVGTIKAFRLDRNRNYRIYNILILIWAFMVGLSRIFVGMHFTGDVMTGFCVGAIIALLMSAAATYAIKTFLKD